MIVLIFASMMSTDPQILRGLSVCSKKYISTNIYMSICKYVRGIMKLDLAKKSAFEKSN